MAEKLIRANAVKETANVLFGDPILKMAVNAAVDAVPEADAAMVDEIKLHYLVVRKGGTPEIGIQLGDKYLTLQTNPVSVAEVVYCKGCKHWKDSWVAPDGKSEHGYCHLEEADDVIVGRWDNDFCSYGERETK